MTDHPAPNPNQPDALVTRVLRSLPEDFWDVHVWAPSACASGSLDVADRKRIVAAVLPEVERHAKADALREAGRAPMPEGYLNVRAWLTQRAEQIERGDDRG